MMTSREQFESWLEDVHGLYGEDVEWEPERNCYAKFGIHLAWLAWQASRTAIEIKSPDFIDSRAALNKGYTVDYSNGFGDAMDAYEMVIEQAGLEVKK